MTPGPDPTPPGGEASPDVEELKASIEETRQHLAETVDALSAKADVKARVSAKAGELKGRAQDLATDDQGRVKPVLPAGAAVVVVVIGLVALLVWRRRR